MLLGILIVCLFTACDPNRVLDDYQTIPDASWSMKAPLKWSVDIADTTIPYNFYINLRHDEAYKYQNLFLFIKTTFPNNKHKVDTLECLLTDRQDQWLGDVSFNLYDNKILFKRNVLFPLKGKYNFEIQHGMRQDPLDHIVDLGMRIEKAEVKGK